MGGSRGKLVAPKALFRGTKRKVPITSLRKFLSVLFLLVAFGLLSTVDLIIRNIFDSLYPKLEQRTVVELENVHKRVAMANVTRTAGLGWLTKEQRGIVDLEPMEWREETVQVKWKGRPLEEVIRERIDAATKEDARKWADQPFQLHIQLLGGCEGRSLETALDALQSASYGEDEVQLTVAVNCTEVLSTVQGFQWSHGTKRILQTGEGEEELDVLRSWWPEADKEHLFFVAAASKLSPGFYTALKTAAHTASAPPGGASLNPALNPGTKVRGRALLARQGGPHGTREGAEGAEGEAGQGSENWGESLLGILLDPQAPPLVRSGVAGGVRDGARPPRLGTRGAPLGGAFLSQTLGSGCQLVFPRAWRRFWEWDAVEQGPQADTDEIKYDAEAYDFSATCRADWQASLLTYAVERGLFNLHVGVLQGGEKFCVANPEPDPLAALTANPMASASQAAASAPLIAPIRRLAALPRFDYCGRRMPAGAVAHNATSLKELLGPIARDGAVVGVMASPGYDDMLHNWLCYVKELSLRNFFIITQDRVQAERLSARGLAVYHAQAERAGAGADPLDYGSVAYKKFILARTRTIGEILHAGYNVLLADVDAVWFSDPFLHMREEKVDMFAQLEERGNPCGGFLFLIHTKTVLQIWDLITAMFAEHITWLETHGSRRSPAEYERFLKGQQHSHEQKYLQDALQSGRHQVRLRGLDSLLFINGRDYFDRKKAQLARVVPVMIHNNYIVGKANKTHRFQIKGMWRVDRSGLSCKCLTLSCEDYPAPWSTVKVTLPETELRRRGTRVPKQQAGGAARGGGRPAEKRATVGKGIIEKGISSVAELVTGKGKGRGGGRGAASGKGGARKDGPAGGGESEREKGKELRPLEDGKGRVPSGVLGSVLRTRGEVASEQADGSGRGRVEPKGGQGERGSRWSHLRAVGFGNETAGVLNRRLHL